MKAVVNTCTSSRIANDSRGAQALYMDNKFTCPELFAILQENLKLLAVGTCWKNRKGFPDKGELHILPCGDERDNFKRLYNGHFQIVAT
eukprot:6843860-Ditylum_brightwellii.AAC.1